MVQWYNMGVFLKVLTVLLPIPDVVDNHFIKKSPAIPEYTIPLETEKVEISIEDPGWTSHYIISRKEASKRRGWTMDYDVFPIGEEEFSSFLSSLRTLDLKLQPEVEVAKDADFGSGGFFFKLILFDKHGRQLANYWYSVTLTGDRYGNRCQSS